MATNTPAAAIVKSKTASTPTTVVSAVKPKTSATISPKIGTPITTGGAAGHAGVGAVAGVRVKTAATPTTTQTVATTKTVVAPKVTAVATKRTAGSYLG